MPGASRVWYVPGGAGGGAERILRDGFAASAWGLRGGLWGLGFLGGSGGDCWGFVTARGVGGDCGDRECLGVMLGTSWIAVGGRVCVCLTEAGHGSG